MEMKYTVTLPNGAVATRKSRTMPYTHALAVLDPGPVDRWVCLSWHTTEALAYKAYAGSRYGKRGIAFKILPVTAEPIARKTMDPATKAKQDASRAIRNCKKWIANIEMNLTSRIAHREDEIARRATWSTHGSEENAREYVDGKIAEMRAQLERYQAQLPELEAARAALEDSAGGWEPDPIDPSASMYDAVLLANRRKA